MPFDRNPNHRYSRGEAKIGDGKSARSRSRKARQATIEIHATKVRYYAERFAE